MSAGDIIKTVVTVCKKLKDAVELLSENEKAIYALVPELISETEDLMNLRLAHSDVHATDLDKTLEVLALEYEAIHTELEALLPKRGKGSIKRVFKWGKNLYHASSVKKKVGKQRDRVRDARDKFLVKNNVSMALNMNDMNDKLEKLRKDLISQAEGAEGDVVQAGKIFGIDQMTTEQRKVELRKTTLDLSITTKEEQRFLIQMKIRTLNAAIKSGAPTLYKTSAATTAYDYKSNFSDSFFYRAWRRQDALIETIELLDVLQNSDSLSSTPAIISFIRADSLSISLRALGIRKEALQLCMIAHEIIESLWKSNPEFYKVHLAESLETLSVCRSDMGQLDDALAAIEEAVDIRRGLAKTNGDAFNHVLAVSLNNLSDRLSDLGRRHSFSLRSQLASIDFFSDNTRFTSSPFSHKLLSPYNAVSKR